MEQPDLDRYLDEVLIGGREQCSALRLTHVPSTSPLPARRAGWELVWWHLNTRC